MQSVLQLPLPLEMLGVIVGAMCGALTACDRKLDIIGGVGLGMICALGGGLMRDVIMQVGSVYMLDSPLAIPVATGTALLVYFFHSPFAHRPQMVEWLDIISVALFAAAGADKAMVNGLELPAVLLMGVLTGNGGGFMRDIVLGDEPKIFKRANWYAICSLGGSLVYWMIALVLGLDKGIAGTISVVVTVAMRRASLRYDLKSPADVDFTPKVKESLETIRRVRTRTRPNWRKSRPRKLRK